MSQDFRSSACSTEQLCVPSYSLDGRKQDESCTGRTQTGRAEQARAMKVEAAMWGHGGVGGEAARGCRDHPWQGAVLCSSEKQAFAPGTASRASWRRPWCAGHRQAVRECVRGTQAMTEKTLLLQEGDFERTDDNRTL